MNRPQIRGLVMVVGLLALGLAATVYLEATGRDLAWTELFYRKGGQHGGWVYARDAPWSWLYDYGEVPGILLAIGALFFYIAIRLGKAPRRYSRACLVMVLTVVLGPGLLVNGLLKNYWGRPRPCEVTIFGGDKNYRSVCPPGGPGQGKSFTCGHCSVAYSLASGMALYPCHPLLATGFVVVAAAFGTLTGMARIAQGGHFPTDVLWSGILVYVLILALYYFVFRIPDGSKDT